MATTRPGLTRFTLDLDRQLQRRLKVAAALKGVSMREYVTEALTKTLERDIGELKPLSTEWIERLKATRDEIFKGRTLPGNSADLIRDAREERTRQMEQW